MVLVGRARFTLERKGFVSNMAVAQGLAISSSKFVEIVTVPFVAVRLSGYFPTLSKVALVSSKLPPVPVKSVIFVDKADAPDASNFKSL